MMTRLKNNSLIFSFLYCISLPLAQPHALRAYSTFESAQTARSPESGWSIFAVVAAAYQFVTGQNREEKRVKKEKHDLETKYASWNMYDFKNAFGYENQKAFQAHHLYRFTEFKRYVYQLPGFFEYIDHLRNTIKNDTDFQVVGCDAKDFKKLINQFHTDLQQISASQVSSMKIGDSNLRAPAQHISPSKPSHHTALINTIHQHAPELKTLYAHYSNNIFEHQLTPSTSIIKRTEALHNYVQCTDSYREEIYEISPHGKKLLHSQSISINNYELFYGNQIQRVLHQEFVDIINGAGNFSLLDKSPHNDWGHVANTITQFAHTGQQHNRYGHIPQSFVFADFCHGMLKLADACIEVECDIGCAIGRGFLKGGDQYALKVIHPIETVQNTLLGLGKLLIKIEKITFETTKKFIITNKQDALDIYNGKVTQWDILKRDALSAYRTAKGAYKTLKHQWKILDYHTMLLAIENTSAFATESALTAGLLTGMSVLTQNASTGLSNYLIQNPPFIELPLNAHTFEAAIAYQSCAAEALAAKTVSIKYPAIISPTALMLSKSDDDGIGSFDNKPKNKPRPFVDDLQSKYKIPLDDVDEIAENIKKLDSNAQHHILSKKHLWERLVNDPDDWDAIARIMTKVMKEGTEELYQKTGRKIHLQNNYIKQRILKIGEEIVQVNFNTENGIIQISNAWVRA